MLGSLFNSFGWHGVTTVVMGNCGVGFAPVKPGDENFLIQLMEGVEDIPGTALHEGIDWEWETFPEFLDAIKERICNGFRIYDWTWASKKLCDGLR